MFLKLGSLALNLRFVFARKIRRSETRPVAERLKSLAETKDFAGVSLMG